MRRLTLNREALTELTRTELAAVPGAGFVTDNIICILSGMRTCEGQELTDTCPNTRHTCP